MEEENSREHKKLLLFSLFLVMLVGIVLLVPLIQAAYRLDWTGFNTYISPSIPSTMQYQRAKTLWDWMQLLIIPVVLAVGGFVVTHLRDKTDHKIASDNQQETALQDYLDRIAELLLDKNLQESKADAEVRKVARARTLTVLRRLDPHRKGSVIQFLYEAGLIKANAASCIIDLKGANLYRTHLSEIDLSGANLSGTNMKMTNLSVVNLQKANLSKADLSESHIFKYKTGRLKIGPLFSYVTLSFKPLNTADLQGTNLSEADLSEVYFYGANLSRANLSKAKLSGANLSKTKLCETNLKDANLRNANLCEADLSGASLLGADLRGADLRGVNLEVVLSLERTNLRRAKGLTKEQLIAGKAKGAIVDEDIVISSPQAAVSPAPISQSNNAQAPSASLAQANTPPPSTDGSNATSSQPDSGS